MDVQLSLPLCHTSPLDWEMCGDSVGPDGWIFCGVREAHRSPNRDILAKYTSGSWKGSS